MTSHSRKPKNTAGSRYVTVKGIEHHLPTTPDEPEILALMVGEYISGPHKDKVDGHIQNPMSKDQIARCQAWVRARVEYMRAHPINTVRPADPSRLEITPNV
jgi:hypothetical protein